MKWLTAGIGYLGLIIGVVAYQFNSHKKIVLSKALTDTIFGIQYLLLGGLTGAMMNFIGLVRDLTLAKFTKPGKRQYLLIGLFTAVLITATALTWSGPLSLMGLVAKSCTTVAFSIKSPKLLRLFTIPSCLLWCIYDFIIGSYGGSAYELFGLGSIMVAYFRYDFKKQNETIVVSK